MTMRSNQRLNGSGQYEVGYGRPPAHSRFKRGQSGNPRGRPRGSANFQTVFNKVMNKKVLVREGPTVRQTHTLEAIIEALRVAALKGDARAVATIFRTLQGFPQSMQHQAHHIEVSFVSPKKDADD
jgi:hypothetical protein